MFAELWAGAHGTSHHEIWKYFQSISKAHAKVLQNHSASQHGHAHSTGAFRRIADFFAQIIRQKAVEKRKVLLGQVRCVESKCEYDVA